MTQKKFSYSNHLDALNQVSKNSLTMNLKMEKVINYAIIQYNSIMYLILPFIQSSEMHTIIRRSISGPVQL